MSNDPSDEQPGKFVKFIKDLLIEFKQLISDRQWDALLLISAFSIWLLFNPGDGFVINSLGTQELPSWYNTLFLSIVTVLGILAAFFIVFDKKVTSLGTVKLSKTDKFIYTAIAAFTLTTTIFSITSFLNTPVSFSSYVACIDTSGDCFSMGENILITRNAFEPEKHNQEEELASIMKDVLAEREQLISFDLNLVRDEPWKEICKDNWKLKSTATGLYAGGDFAEARNSFSDFLTKCPNDPEAQIYLENAQSKQFESKQNSSFWRIGRKNDYLLHLAVVVPASIRDGYRESQEILRGVALAQREFNTASRERKLVIGIADDGFKEDNTSSQNTLIRRVEERHAANRVANFIAFDRSDILGVIGHFTSDATDEAAECYNNRLVAISPTSTAVRPVRHEQDSTDEQNSEEHCLKSKQTIDNLDDQKFDPGNYVFRTALNDGRAIETLIERGELTEHVAIVYESDSTYSQSFKEELSSRWMEQAGKIVNPPQDNSDKCNFSKSAIHTPQDCLDMIYTHMEELDIGVDEVTLFLIPSTKNNLRVREIIQLNYENANANTKLPLIGADSMYDADFETQSANGMRIFVSWHREESDLSDIEYRAAAMFSQSPSEFTKILSSQSSLGRDQILKSGHEINWRTKTAYDAAHVLSNAANNVAARCRFPQKVRNPFNKVSFESCLREQIFVQLSSENDYEGIFSNGERNDENSQLGAVIQVDCDSSSQTCEFVKL